MFYSTQILAKKGALSTIWMAAHLEKRLKRNQVFETSIPASVDSILNPEAPLALRLSGQLLLGVVRVYSKKVGYLYVDCNEALTKMKQAFKPAEVDLPEEGAKAPVTSITLPENYNDIEFHLGTGGGLTFTFDPEDLGIPLPFNFGGRESIMLMESQSLYGSQYSPLHEDEHFEAAGDAMDIHFDLRPERLRAAQTPVQEPERNRTALEAQIAQGPMFDEPMADDVFGADEFMAVPPDDMGLPGMGSPQRQHSLAPSERPTGLTPGQTPLSAGGDPLDLSAGFGMPSAAGDSVRARSSAGNQHEETSPDVRQAAEGAAAPGTDEPAAAGQRSARKRRVKLDVLDRGENSRAATMLPNMEIRALLEDRAPLMTTRGAHSRQLLPDESALMGDDGQMENLLDRPPMFGMMAPELMNMFQRATKSRAAGRKRRAPAAQLEEVPEAQEAEEAAEVAPEAAQTPVDHAEAGPSAWEDAGAGFEEQQFDAEAPMSSGFGAGPSITQDVDMEDAAAFEPARSTGGVSGGVAEEVAGPSGIHALRTEALEVEDEEEEASDPAEAKAGFTKRTEAVLRGLQEVFGAEGPIDGKKRKRPAAPAVSVVGVDSMVEGKGRRAAARTFFDLLALRTTGYVDLEQKVPYGDILITPMSKLLN